MFNNFWFRKEKPFTGFAGFGGGATGLGAAGGAAVDNYDVSGGTAITSGDYKYHVFYQTGSLTLTQNDDGLFGPTNSDNSGNFDYLVVGGGGGGGATRGSGNGGRGGGGAGGIRSNSPSYPFSTPDTALTAPTDGAPYTYTVTVGAGGAAQNQPTYPTPPNRGVDGGLSSIIGPDHPGSGGSGGLVASGGGGGTAYPGQPSGNGGSGGGGAYGSLVDGTTIVSPDGLSSTTQGYPGGGGSGRGGGGGGAGGAGAGDGGAAVTLPQFPGPVLAPGIPTGPAWGPAVSTGKYAGGGGGGGGYASSVGGDGGSSIGGWGSDNPSYPNASAGQGIEYTGSGGGGGAGGGSFTAADGGNGVVIVRYKYQQTGRELAH